MVECINRDELIGDIQYTFDGLAESWVQASERIIDIIREAPEVPQKEYTEQQIRDMFNCGYSCGMHNEWITDELPIDGQEVIATVHWMDYGDTITAYGHYNARFDTWSLYSDVEGKLNKGFEVIAWIPVPEPYREESEDKE